VKHTNNEKEREKQLKEGKEKEIRAYEKKEFERERKYTQ
jgi:hypothetical protein